MDAKTLYGRYKPRIDEEFERTWKELLDDQSIPQYANPNISLDVAKELARAQFISGLIEGRRIAREVDNS